MTTHTEYADAIALKSALEELLGSDTWYTLKDTSSLATWKKALLRALSVSEAAVDGSVRVADEAWMQETHSILRCGKERVKGSRSIEDAFAAFGACYLRLSFHQLGLMPNATGESKRTRATPSSWDLRTYRSVQYVQSEQQKLVLEFSEDDRPHVEKLMDPRYSNLR